MPIVKTFDFYDFKREFQIYNKEDQFSDKALARIFYYLSECYSRSDWEMDCIAICCEFQEMTYQDILQDYDVYTNDNMTNEELADQAREYLHDNTSLVGEYANDKGETVFIFVAF